ncbi:DNA-directed RNA polymerase II subunit RPB1 [Hordeum vulgare]|nr:DNA-directed RNA polymerase II subunit RPB1 [Hordeum vulgare]
MQPRSEKATEGMEYLLPHEIAERELEMQEAADIEERQEEELCVAEDEVEKSLSVDELVVEYQHEIWFSHYYEYYNLEGCRG